MILDTLGNILWASNAAAGLLGYSAAELRATSLISVGPLGAALKKLHAGEAAEVEGEAEFTGATGANIPIHWKVSRLETVGDSHFLLQLARISAGPFPVQSYRDFFDSSVAGLFRATAEGRFIEVNAAFSQIFGYATPADFMAAAELPRPSIFVNSEVRATFLQAMVYDGFVSGFEAECHMLGNEKVWVGIFARTVFSDAGAPLYFEGTAIDITERKRIDTALRWSQERFRRLAESSRVVPFEFDARAQAFTYLGPQAETLFGPSFRRGLTLESWSSMVHPDDLEVATRFAQEFTWTETGELQAEFRIVDIPGRPEVWIKQIVHRETAELQNRIRGFLFEITQAKVLEEERERSRSHLRELAARIQLVREEERVNVAREIHDEMGQSLTLLLMDLNWIDARLEAPSTAEAYKTLREKVGSMQQLIHWTLQSMRRILGSLRPPLLDELGLSEAVEFHLKSFSKRIAIRYEFSSSHIDPLPVVSATTIFRIFQEALTNVARHARASRIKVFIGQEDGEVKLRVQDNGRGITQESMNQSKSLGVLGMQERAWAIGGELEIFGSPRSGTTVSLRLPLAKAPIENLSRPEARSDPPSNP